MNELHINISGYAGTGKSGILFLLKEALKESGFNATVLPNVDYKDESELDLLIGSDDHMEQRLNRIKKNTTIYLQEVQLNHTII